MKKIMSAVGISKLKFDHVNKFSDKLRWVCYSWRFYDRETEVTKRGLRLLGVAIHLQETDS